jgi:hypothetical protein
MELSTCFLKRLSDSMPGRLQMVIAACGTEIVDSICFFLKKEKKLIVLFF